MYRVLGTILPKNDADFFDQRESVAYRWLEIDEQRVVHREVGFTMSGTAIRCAPVGRNRGMFVGEEIRLAQLAAAVQDVAFEEAWERAARRVSPYRRFAPGSA
jgi:hypothetical protein